MAGAFPDVSVHRHGVRVELAYRFVFPEPCLPDEVRARAEGRGADDHGQAVKLRSLDVALVDAAQDWAALRVPYQRGYPDVRVHSDIRLEHDACLDPAVGQDRGATADGSLELNHAAPHPSESRPRTLLPTRFPAPA